jgi:uncharacterized protein (TIGR03085 family)
MAHFAADERRALAKTLRSADANSPTLCGDWTVAQLTAHVVLRERSVVELLGRLPNKRLQRVAQREIDDFVAREPYDRLVDAVDAGPSWTDLAGPIPVAWAWSVPIVREQANLLEYLVHHEDVRRAAPGWQPRDLPADVQSAVWKRLPNLTRLTMRSLSLGVELVSPAHGELRTSRARRAGVAVRVTGEPVELALFAFGRHAVAVVDYDGKPDDVATIRGAKLGI